jgi:hypothetical protein
MKFEVNVPDSVDLPVRLVEDYIRSAIRSWGHGADPDGDWWAIAESQPTVKSIKEKGDGLS